MSERNRTQVAVVATTEDDSHVWNLIGVQLRLEERGFTVVNLGACTPAELVAETLRDLRPAMLVISTINGHGRISIPHLLQTLEQYQVKKAARIVVGGLLATDAHEAARSADDLRELGCAGVYTGSDAWACFDADRVSSSAESSGRDQP